MKVLLCGVREDFGRVLEELHFYDWLPRERVFAENGSAESSTLHYDLP